MHYEYATEIHSFSSRPDASRDSRTKQSGQISDFLTSTNYLIETFEAQRARSVNSKVTLSDFLLDTAAYGSASELCDTGDVQVAAICMSLAADKIISI